MGCLSTENCDVQYTCKCDHTHVAFDGEGYRDSDKNKNLVLLFDLCVCEDWCIKFRSVIRKATVICSIPEPLMTVFKNASECDSSEDELKPAPADVLARGDMVRA